MRPNICFSVLAAGCLLALGPGCPEPTAPSGDAGADAEVDAGPPARTYLMGGLAQKYVYNASPRWSISLDKLTTPEPPDGSGAAVDMAEAVVVPAYHLGIPWSEFDAAFASSLPGPWIKEINAAKALVAAVDKPVILALSPTSLEWDNLAPEARDDGFGELEIKENWLQSYCHDPSQDGNPKQWEEAYVRYVEWMVDQFNPQFVVLAHRINRYDERCGDASPNAYAAVANFATAAHNALKSRATSPTTIVTVDVEDLYGYTVAGAKPGRCVIETPQECLELRKGLLDAFTADRLGLESYPGEVLRFIKEIPADWLDRVASIREDMPPLIAGTGIGAERVETSQAVCVPLVESDQQLQLQWLDQVLGAASKYSMELVVWNSPVDQLSAQLIAPCQCSGDFEICEHLNQLGSKANATRLPLIRGLFTDDGTAREAGRVWVEQLAQ